MGSISLIASVNITGKSKRTLWRRVAEGELPRYPDDAEGLAMVCADAVRAQACIPFDDTAWALVLAADQGDATAQNDVALLFLAANRPEAALFWLEKAAAQQHPDALHWLARCHVQGWGVPKNEDRGLMFLASSAAAGHAISKAQMDTLRAAQSGQTGLIGA